MTGCACMSARPPTDQYQLIQRAGGRRRGNLSRPEDHRRALRRIHPPLIPKSRGACPATISTTCCRRTAFMSLASLVGSESTCALTLCATVRLIPFPACRALMVLGYADAPRRRRRRDCTSASWVPWRSKASTSSYPRQHAPQGQDLPGNPCCRTARLGCSSNSAATDQSDANAKVEAAFATLRHRRLGRARNASCRSRGRPDETMGDARIRRRRQPRPGA